MIIVAIVLAVLAVAALLGLLSAALRYVIPVTTRHEVGALAEAARASLSASDHRAEASRAGTR